MRLAALVVLGLFAAPAPAQPFNVRFGAVHLLPLTWNGLPSILIGIPRGANSRFVSLWDPTRGGSYTDVQLRVHLVGTLDHQECFVGSRIGLAPFDNVNPQMRVASLGLNFWTSWQGCCDVLKWDSGGDCIRAGYCDWYAGTADVMVPATPCYPHRGYWEAELTFLIVTPELR
jgi:hypothetical protein